MRKAAIILVGVLVAFFVGFFVAAAKMNSVPAAAPIAPPSAPQVSPVSVPLAFSSDAKSDPAPIPGYSLEPQRHNFGTALEGEYRNQSFDLVRPSGAPIKLGRLYSTCPCVTVTARKQQIAQNEDATVNVWVHTLNLQGVSRFPIYVELVEPVVGILRADVEIDVKPVTAKLAVVPDAFHLGSIRGKTNTSVRLYNLTRQPVRLKNISCPLKGIKVSALEGLAIDAGQSATISLDIAAADLPAGLLNSAVSIETDCAAHARMEIPVDGTVLPSNQKP